MAPVVAEIAFVAIGGATGAICRYWMQQSAWGINGKFLCTMGINMLGCLAIGIVWSILNHCNAPIWVNRLLVAGFLGGFTTFSAFALDAVTLMHAGRITQAALYVGISVTAGIVMCWLGLRFTEKFIALIS